MYEKITAVLKRDYDCETPDKLRSKDFQEEYYKEVVKKIKLYGFRLIKLKGNYCECSGFITDDKGHFCYFNSGDYRHKKNKIFNDVLIRSVKNEKDFSGGPNRFCRLYEIGATANRIIKLQKTLQQQKSESKQ